VAAAGAPWTTLTDAAATPLASTVARKVVSTARLAARGMASGAHHPGRCPLRMGSSTRYADAVATAMIAARRTLRSVRPTRCVRVGDKTSTRGQYQRYIPYEIRPT
jgi:hypothetical protein